jgi:hypothetical protein
MIRQLIDWVFYAPICLIIERDGKEQTLNGKVNPITGIYRVGQIETTRNQLAKKIATVYNCKLLSMRYE